MGRLSDEVTKLREQLTERNVLKVAYDVTVAMQTKEQIEDSDFYETVEQLRQRPIDDLQKRAEILSVIDTSMDLALGEIDVREDGVDKNGSPSGSHISEATPSVEATDAGRSIIDSYLNSN